MIAVTVFALACLVIALTIQIIRYERELRRMARFLDDSAESRNSSCKVNVRSRGFVRLANAMNGVFSRHREERLAYQNHQRDMQQGLAHLSHDIRTPLTGARGYAQLLEDEESKVVQAQYLEAIIRRLDDQKEMVDQLFMFSQVNDQDYEIEMETLDGNEVLTDVLLALYPEFTAQGLMPQVELGSEGCSVIAQEEALKRIMQNLIVNGLRHGGGTLRIEQKGSSYIFANRVADPEAIDAERLFERFYRADASRMKQGSGLGLAIVKQLCSAMGATVAAEIADGELSITVTLRSA